jgi:hypothetical protein
MSHFSTSSRGGFGIRISAISAEPHLASGHGRGFCTAVSLSQEPSYCGMHHDRMYDELLLYLTWLECLLLQGIFHTNGGNPKRAWLSFRRAGNIGHLMGIDKIGNTIPGGSERWYQIVQEDHYLVCFHPYYTHTLTYRTAPVASPWLAISPNR